MICMSNRPCHRRCVYFMRCGSFVRFGKAIVAPNARHSICLALPAHLIPMIRAAIVPVWNFGLPMPAVVPMTAARAPFPGVRFVFEQEPEHGKSNG